jgi:hypothetical protein
MDTITFYCRGEPLTLTKNEIESLTDADWFISLLIKYNDDDEKTELCEDIDIVKSIIETLRYKKIVMYKNISITHMKMLCDKWCLPEWVIQDLEIIEKKTIEVIENKPTDEKIYLCQICRVGFKKSENFSNSCNKHSNICNTNGLFHCCNKQEPCVVGYHYSA